MKRTAATPVNRGEHKSGRMADPPRPPRRALTIEDERYLDADEAVLLILIVEWWNVRGPVGLLRQGGG